MKIIVGCLYLEIIGFILLSLDDTLLLLNRAGQGKHGHGHTWTDVIKTSILGTRNDMMDTRSGTIIDGRYEFGNTLGKGKGLKFIYVNLP